MTARGLATNYCVRSESLTTSPWSNVNVTTSAASSPFPTDGSSIAAGTVLTGNNTVGQHYASQVYSSALPGVITSCYVKKISGNGWVALTSELGPGYAYFNLNTGVLGSVGSGTIATIVDVGNGWYRIAIQCNQGIPSFYVATKLAQANGTVSYDATGDAIAVSGVMVEGSYPGQTTPSSYMVTTSVAVTGRREYRQNLLLWSSDQSNAIWLKQNSATAGSPTTNNGRTACLVDVSANASANIYQQGALKVLPNSMYTFGVWLRSDTPGNVFLVDGGTGYGGNVVYVTSTWQQFTSSSLTTGTGTYSPRISRAANNPALQFYVSDVQANQGPSLQPYVRTTSSASNASGSPRALLTSDPSLIFAVDFTTKTVGSASSILPATRLQHTRASVATVQTGTSTVNLSLAVDEAGIGRATDAGLPGLVIEESRTNYIGYARDPNSANNPSSGTVVYGSGTGIDGSTITTAHVTVSSGGYAKWWSYTPGSTGPYTGSLWRTGTGTSWQSSVNTTGSALASGGNVSAWGRFAATQASVTSGVAVVLSPLEGRDLSASGGIVAGARDATLDLMQIEAGKFATEAIVTSGATVTRSGSRLWVPYANMLIRFGLLTPALVGSTSDLFSSCRFEFRYLLQAKGATTDYATDPYLWYIDANNYARISATTGAITMVVNASSYTTASGVTWAQGDILDIRLACGGSALQSWAKIGKNGGALTHLGTSASAQIRISPSSTTVDLLQDGSAGNVFSCRLYKFEAYAPGTLQSVT